MSLGPSEIIVVLLVALIVLGPDKLPQAARTMAKYLAEFRKFSASVHAQVDDVLRLPDKPSTPAEAERPAEPEEEPLPAKPEVPDGPSPLIMTPEAEAANRPANPDTSGFEPFDETKPEEPKE